MSAPVKYNPAGVDIVDEKLIFDEVETIGVTEYYVGWVSNITDKAVEGDDSPTYGAWTAVSKGGTRQTILLEGVPGGANEIVWDITTGKILCLDNTTLYARYKGYGQILEIPQVILRYPFEMVDGVSNVDYVVHRVKRNCTIEKYAIAVDGATSATPITLQLRDALAGAGSNEPLTLPGSNTRITEITDLTSPLPFTTGGLMVLGNFDGGGISIVTVTLY